MNSDQFKQKEQIRRMELHLAAKKESQSLELMREIEKRKKKGGSSNGWL
jgi:hypothetical protein